MGTRDPTRSVAQIKTESRNDKVWGSASGGCANESRPGNVTEGRSPWDDRLHEAKAKGFQNSKDEHAITKGGQRLKGATRIST